MAMGAVTGPNGEPARSGTGLIRVLTGLLLLAAAVMLLVSLLLPYWTIELEAPQYPEGLTATTYVTRMTGDVREIDELNHYIGMLKLETAARVEKALAVYLVPVAAALLLLSWFFRGWKAGLMRVPAFIFPFGVVIDLFAWLWYAGHHLDPQAALSSSIKSFTPAIVGRGTIGQFHTMARFEIGFFLAAVGALIVIATLFMEPEPEPSARRRQ